MALRPILLSIPLLLAASLTAASQDGEMLFAQRCGDCHGARAISAWGRKLPNPEQRGLWLEGFLATHHPPPENERAPIIDHIQSRYMRC